MEHNTIDCIQFQRMISMMLDEELNRDSVGLLETHLTTCVECREVLEQMTEINRTIVEIPDPIPAPYLSDRVIEAVKGPRLSRKRDGFFPLWVRVLPAAAGIFASVWIGNMAGTTLSRVISGDRTTTVTADSVVSDQGTFLAATLAEIDDMGERP